VCVCVCVCVFRGRQENVPDSQCNMLGKRNASCILGIEYAYRLMGCLVTVFVVYTFLKRREEKCS